MLLKALPVFKQFVIVQVPPTLHCENKEEYAPVDIVPDINRSQNISRALSNSFGFGGQIVH